MYTSSHEHYVQEKKMRVNQPIVYVVGGGVSGMSAACYLAKQKQYKVVLTEKNARLGGRMDTLVSPDGKYRFDKGPSWLWMVDIWEQFFKAYGTLRSK